MIHGMGKGRREAVKGLGLRVFSSFPFSSLSPSFFSMALEITLSLACTPGKPLTLTCTLGLAETGPHCVAQTSLDLYPPALPSNLTGVYLHTLLCIHF